MEQQEQVFKRLGAAGVIAVVMIEDEAKAVPLARALLAGGVRAMELTLRSEAAMESLRTIAAEVPEMLLGAGTVIDPAQVEAVQAAGAVFGVAPGTNPAVLRAAAERGLPFAPGIATPSDIEAALGFGCRVLKFFPAEAMGGLEYLRHIAAPYRHLGLRYIPLGGVDDSNMVNYGASSDVLAVGGSWITPKMMVDIDDWEGIEKLAELATDIAEAARELQ